MKPVSLFVFVLLACVGSSFSQQDSIILLNGKTFLGEIQKVEKDFIYYTSQNKKGEQETHELETYRIFSYTKNGSETILYTQDEFKGDFLTVSEAQHTTIGCYDARITCKPRFAFWSGVVLGFSASIMDTYYSQKSYDALIKDWPPTEPVPQKNIGFFGGEPSFFPILVPIVLVPSWGLPTFRIGDKKILHKDMYGNEMYYRGYQRIARQKRTFAALKGSLIGIGTGMVTWAVLKTN